MNELWKAAFTIAGIGAIGSFILWSLYSKWIKLPIWVSLTKHQQFVLFTLFLTFTFLFAIAGLITYAMTIQPPQPPNKQLVNTFKDKRKNAIELFAKAKTATGSQQVGQNFVEAETKFIDLTDESIKALENNEDVRAYELRKKLLKHVNSDDFMNAIPKLYHRDFEQECTIPKALQGEIERKLGIQLAPGEA